MSAASADSSRTVAALATAAVAMAPLALAGAGSSVWLAGHDGLWLGLGTACGMVVAGTLLAPPLARGGTPSIAAWLAARYSASTRFVAAAIVALALVVLLSGQLASIGSVMHHTFGLPREAAIPVVGALALLAALLGTRWAMRIAAVCAAVAILAILLLGVALTASAGAALPIAYGGLLQDLSRLEVGLIAQKLADAATMKAHATPYVSLDGTSLFGALAGTIAGTAALAALAQRQTSVHDADAARSACAWGLIALLPVLVLMPAIAIAIKLALYRALAGPLPIAAAPDWLLQLMGSGLATLCGGQPADAAAAATACKTAAGSKGFLRLQDLGLDGAATWLAGADIAGLHPAMRTVPAIAALAAALAACVAALSATTALTTAADDTGHRWRGRFLAAVAAAVAIGLALLAPEHAGHMTPWILPLLASSLLPVLLLGLWWRRATSAGAIAGLAAGAGLALYYLVTTRYFPVGFYDLWQSLSPASLGAERKFITLRDAWTAAADGPAKTAAWNALAGHARGIASWLGLKPAAVALLGLPAAVVAMVLVSLATRRPDADVERLFDRAHAPSVTPP